MTAFDKQNAFLRALVPKDSQGQPLTPPEDMFLDYEEMDAMEKARQEDEEEDHFWRKEF